MLKEAWSINTHTHAYTDTAVWTHLFLWRSELIPAWSHMPIINSKVSRSPPCLHFFFSNSDLFLYHLSTPPVFLLSSLCVPLHFLISVSLPPPALFFHYNLCGFCFLTHWLISAFGPKVLQCSSHVGDVFPRGYMVILLTSGHAVL